MEHKKNILIIGSTSEIAQAIIKTLENTPYTVLTTSRSGGETTYALDLTNGDSITAFKTEIVKKQFYFVLYCAGFITSQESTETFTSGYGLISEQVNFKAVPQLFNSLSANIEGGGGMLALSSTAGIWGNPQFPIYASWKGALNTFLQSLHTKLKDSQKYIFSICPGPTNTQLRQSLAGDALQHQSPAIVAQYISQIIKSPATYADYPILVIRDEKLYSLEQELVSVKQ